MADAGVGRDIQDGVEDGCQNKGKVYWQTICCPALMNLNTSNNLHSFL